jgi:DNA mismatch repair ATPase MutS
MAMQVAGEPMVSLNSARFRSILFAESEPHGLLDSSSEPDFFSDLNLDQVVASITAGYEQYQLHPIFCALPEHPETIRYRQEVFRDLENPTIAPHIGAFAKHMEAMREALAQANKRYHPKQKQWGLLAAIDWYCLAVGCLTQDLKVSPIGSEGLGLFTEYLSVYRESEPFQSLARETRALRAQLGHVSYRLYLRDNRIEVSRATAEPDYSDVVEHTFDKFREHEAGEYQFNLLDSQDMNHVEVAVLDLVARLYASVFQSLEQYCERHRNFLDGIVAAFDREVQFYLAFLAHIQRMQHSGLPFCYPDVNTSSKEIDCRDVFDLALADRLSTSGQQVILNDLLLKEQERVIVVTGANQGGKTTFARLCGQLHYLGRLGCLVPGRSARLLYFDHLFTHFEREEDLRTLHSKLEHDLTRIHAILERATERSFLIMNESFSSATLHDALLLSGEIMRRIVAKDLVCVFVTFLDELASFGPTTVSMTSMVDPNELARRTFRITRRAADGLAYAMALAERYGLTYEGVKHRIDR